MSVCVCACVCVCVCVYMCIFINVTPRKFDGTEFTLFHPPG